MKTTASLPLAAALALAVVPARAQAPATSVPIGIVRALFGNPESLQADSGLRIYLGALPPQADARLLPGKPVSVVASSASSYGTTVVLAYPLGHDDAAESYLAFLQGAGWTRPAPPAERGGFVAAAQPGRSMWLCRDSVRAAVLPLGGAPAGQRYVRAHFYDSRSFERCDAEPRRDPFDFDLDFPKLVAPPGATMVGGGSGAGGPDSREITTRLATTMSASDLLAHYAAQLRAAGWTVGERLVDSAISAQAVTAHDSKGKEWRGMLSAIPTGATRDVRLYMARVDLR